MMQIEDQRLLTEWQANRHLPAPVRLEEDFDALLDVIDFIMNAPPELAAALGSFEHTEGDES